jgi:hypothetical protein
MLYIHLDAGRTASGNPRRLFLVIDPDTAQAVDAVDEGYEGRAAVQREYPGIKEGPRLATTPAEYRALLRWARNPKGGIV